MANSKGPPSAQLPTLAETLYPHLRINERQTPSAQGERPLTIADALYPTLRKSEPTGPAAPEPTRFWQGVTAGDMSPWGFRKEVK